MKPWDELIHKEHETLKTQAGVLDTTLGIDVPAQDRRVVLSWTLRNLGPEVELHLRKEEEALFPTLKHLLKGGGSALILLRKDHEEIRTSLRHLAELLQDPSNLDWDRIELAVQAFLYLFEEHEKIEDRLLLDVLQFNLNHKELMALADKYHQIAEKAHEEEGWPTPWWNLKPNGTSHERSSEHAHRS